MRQGAEDVTRQWSGVLRSSPAGYCRDGRIEATDRDDNPLTRSEHLAMIVTYPEDAAQAYDVNVERWSAWAELLVLTSLASVGVAFLLDALVSYDHWLRIGFIYLLFFVTGLFGVAGVLSGVRILIVALWGEHAFRQERSEFDSDEEAERSWRRFGGRGYSRIGRWLCVPSNAEVALGVVVGVVGS